MKKKVSLTLINSKYFPQTWFFCFDSMNFVKCCSFRNHIYLVLKKMTQTHRSTHTQKAKYKFKQSNHGRITWRTGNWSLTVALPYISVYIIWCFYLFRFAHSWLISNPNQREIWILLPDARNILWKIYIKRREANFLDFVSLFKILLSQEGWITFLITCKTDWADFTNQISFYHLTL